MRHLTILAAIAALTFQRFRIEVAGPVTSFVPLNAQDLLLGL